MPCGFEEVNAPWDTAVVPGVVDYLGTNFSGKRRGTACRHGKSVRWT